MKAREITTDPFFFSTDQMQFEANFDYFTE